MELGRNGHFYDFGSVQLGSVEQNFTAMDQQTNSVDS